MIDTRNKSIYSRASTRKERLVDQSSTGLFENLSICFHTGANMPYSGKFKRLQGSGMEDMEWPCIRCDLPRSGMIGIRGSTADGCIMSSQFLL
jgi:hypothetical protein